MKSSDAAPSTPGSGTDWLVRRAGLAAPASLLSGDIAEPTGVVEELAVTLDVAGAIALAAGGSVLTGPARGGPPGAPMAAIALAAGGSFVTGPACGAPQAAAMATTAIATPDPMTVRFMLRSLIRIPTPARVRIRPPSPGSPGLSSRLYPARRTPDFVLRRRSAAATPNRARGSSPPVSREAIAQPDDVVSVVAFECAAASSSLAPSVPLASSPMPSRVAASSAAATDASLWITQTPSE